MKILQPFSSSRFNVVSKLPLGEKMGERNYNKTGKTCYISNQQFSENFSEAHWSVKVYTNIEVDNKHFCESNSAIYSKNQVLSTLQNSYWTSPIESNIE